MAAILLDDVGRCCRRPMVALDFLEWASHVGCVLTGGEPVIRKNELLWVRMMLAIKFSEKSSRELMKVISGKWVPAM